MLPEFLPGAFGRKPETARRILLRFGGTGPSDSIHQNPKSLFPGSENKLDPKTLSRGWRY